MKRSKHTISLYANISSIKWDYTSDNVKGWLTTASSASRAATMRAFEMEHNSTNTDYAIANTLWELMETA